MAQRIRRQNSLRDQIHFLGRLVSNPRTVGAIAPSGPILARAMASQISANIVADPAARVLELGPGPGAMTRAMLERGIAPEQITLVERDQEFVRLLSERFPDITIHQGDAFALDDVLGERGHDFSAAISGLPLLNFPLVYRNALIEDVLARLRPGAPLIQFSYGMTAPVAAPAGASVRHAAFVWGNLPPAHVWVYRRKT